MRLSKKLAIIFMRPVYRAFFERPLWWFLARVKACFFAEVGVQLGKQCRAMERSQATAISHVPAAGTALARKPGRRYRIHLRSYF